MTKTITARRLDDPDALIPLSRAARELPGRPHPATLHRWATKGLIVNGVRHRLEVELIGRRIFVTRGSMRAFSAALGRAYGAAWDSKVALDSVRATTS